MICRHKFITDSHWLLQLWRLTVCSAWQASTCVMLCVSHRATIGYYRLRVFDTHLTDWLPLGSLAMSILLLAIDIQLLWMSCLDLLLSAAVKLSLTLRVWVILMTIWQNIKSNMILCTVASDDKVYCAGRFLMTYHRHSGMGTYGFLVPFSYS